MTELKKAVETAQLESNTAEFFADLESLRLSLEDTGWIVPKDRTGSMP